ncbi:hypothetical protein SAMN05443580_1338 [Variovorax sp. OV084]|jgi:hypothetical protein|nr:hypothetical protein SAMN05443580_1338 [Variovorax sp. OV084]
MNRGDAAATQTQILDSNPSPHIGISIRTDEQRLTAPELRTATTGDHGFNFRLTTTIA